MKLFTWCSSFCLLIVSYLTCIAHGTDEITTRYLCAEKSFQDVDCTSKVFGPNYVGDGTCTVKYYPNNSSECSQFSFSESSENGQDLGDFRIIPDFYDHLDIHVNIYTFFHLTFSNSKWNRLKFRFSGRNNTNSNKPKNHCREIIINGDLPDNFVIPSLDYNCIWSEQHNMYVNETFVFEYEMARGDKRRYQKIVLNIPPVNLVRLFRNSTKPFFYINNTNPSKLDLYAIYHNNSFSKPYKIEKCLENLDDTTSECEDGEIINLDENTVITYTTTCNGKQYFRITPIDSPCDKGSCSPILSPKILNVCCKNNIVYTILWNVFWICLVGGTCFSIYWLIKRHRKFTPKILLIHPDSDKLHKDIIKKLAKYLEVEFNWNVVWNDSIELTNHGDPYIWCLDAFMNANTVIYIDKPSDIVMSNDVSGNIYMHMNDIFFKILKSNKHKKDVKLFNIMLDSHDPGAILVELKDFYTYYLPSEWQYFIQSIKRHSWIQNILVKIPPLTSTIQGKELYKALNQS